MSRLARDGTAEPVSRDQILRHARGQGNIHFPCSANHEQDWQPYPVDPYSALCDDHTYIHTYVWDHTCMRPDSHTQLPNNCLRTFLFLFLYFLLFTTPVGYFLIYPTTFDSVGHSTCMSVQGYHGVRVRARVRVSWGGWWVLGGGVSMVICPTGVGIPLYPWQHLDRTVWAAR